MVDENDPVALDARAEVRSERPQFVAEQFGGAPQERKRGRLRRFREFLRRRREATREGLRGAGQLQSFGFEGEAARKEREAAKVRKLQLLQQRAEFEERIAQRKAATAQARARITAARAERRAIRREAFGRTFIGRALAGAERRIGRALQEPRPPRDRMLVGRPPQVRTLQPAMERAPEPERAEVQRAVEREVIGQPADDVQEILFGRRRR